MLLKAIVNYISDDGYTANITIPVLDGYGSYVKSNVHGREAIICSLPGCKPSYGAGDVVFVSFEEDETSKPVVLGTLYRQEQLSQMDINATSLVVDVNSQLPTDTYIGEIAPNNFQSLVDNKDNINKRIEVLSDNKDIINNQINVLYNLVGIIDYITVPPTEDNTEGLKVCVLSSEPEVKYNGWLYIITDE